MADDISSSMEVEGKQMANISPLPFSNSEKEAIEKHLNVSSTKTESADQLVNVYEVDRCVETIKKCGYTKIALQFPDTLLADSASVATLLEKRTGGKVFILADTSYGSCCIDEVAAEHVSAELIIHYGRACLSPTRRLPVLYVFGKQPVDTSRCCEHFKSLFPDAASHVLLMYDVVYSHCIAILEESLKPLYSNLVICKLKLPSLVNTNNDRLLQVKTVQSEGNTGNGPCLEESGHVNVQSNDDFNSKSSEERHQHTDCMETEHLNYKFGRVFTLLADRNIEDYQVFFIGQQSLTLINLMMTYNKCQFCTYDPTTDTSRRETLNINKALMKRYYMIQKAKDAQIVGIVVGTLGVADYLKILERLKKVIEMAGKKSYMFVMGKLNVAKMANFMEVDVFVLVACPENTLIDCQEFYKPIVTPYELEIACLRTQEWTGDYVTDFRELLPGACHSVDLDSQADDEDDIPDMSLITGHLRPNYKALSQDTGASFSTSLVQRSQQTTVATQLHTSGAQFLASRSWQGLEQNLGQTDVAKVIEGRMGISVGYTHEQHGNTEEAIQSTMEDQPMTH